MESTRNSLIERGLGNRPDDPSATIYPQDRKVPIPAEQRLWQMREGDNDYYPLSASARKGFFIGIEGGENMIEINEVVKEYPARGKGTPVTALQGVSLKIERGDIFGIVGYSGAGKSTLLRLINGLESPTSGEVIVDGKNISQLKTKELRLARQKIGMIFQHFHLLWSRTVRDNVAFPLEIAGVPKQKINEKVNHLLERVGLADRADAYPSQLSGGQKQRVGIARALANDPDVLLCDEATSALDPETTASILNLLKEIHKDTGITLVLITHEMSVVRAICNKMAVMENGRVVETGTVEQIFQSPAHPLTKQFISGLDGDEEKPETESGKTLFIPLDKLPSLAQIAKEHDLSCKVIGEVNGAEEKIQVTLSGEAERVEQAVNLLNRR
jgi:D-methionine transport system ATP-binding protein